MIIGLQCNSLKNRKLIKYLKYPTLMIYYTTPLLAMIPFSTSYIFYNYKIDNTAWWIGIWFVISKHFWIIIGFAFIYVRLNDLDGM